MISHDNIAGYPLDTLRHLGETLLEFYHMVKPMEPLVVFKSDISEAYHLLPVHEKWQIKQIITVNRL